MTTIHLKEFVKTGKFRTIAIGSQKNDVIKLLGNKFDFADCDEMQIIKYGWYEFFYYTKTEKICGIQNDHLEADSVYHSYAINYNNDLCEINTWFLKENENITFEQVVEHLNKEDISFDIIPAFKGSEENIIRCIKSNVTFDFSNEYRQVELDEKGKFKNWKELKVEQQADFILNGIRLFEF